MKFVHNTNKPSMFATEFAVWCNFGNKLNKWFHLQKGSWILIYKYYYYYYYNTSLVFIPFLSGRGKRRKGNMVIYALTGFK